ncbi:MAG TPA: ATP-binding protein [Candidatus Paceibacterota bacterium]|nr:ATP-binding protein [Candidatus Paceibacterota bacterium]
MNLINWRAIGWLRELLATRQPDPTHQAERVASVQLHIVLPAKAGVIAVALYYVVFSDSFHDLLGPQTVAMQFLKDFFITYLICNVVAGAILSGWRHLPAGVLPWLVFLLGLLDGIFVAGLIYLTGGYDSRVYWIIPGLIVLNAWSIPLASPQLVLNVLLSVFFLGACVLESNTPATILVDTPAKALRQFYRGTNGPNSHVATNRSALRPDWYKGAKGLPYSTIQEERNGEPVLARMFLLWLLTACCYGAQVLAERQRRVAEEERESAVRQAQLHSAGRLAAEFAHQIKNPLAIINNAAFSIQRGLKAGRTDFMRQIEIIQEEVERSDRIVTQIMGYAQLSEGRVEKLDVAEELDYAISQVFPPGVESGIRVERAYVRNFPPLLMQRRHLSDCLVNLLQNAREALNGTGEITVAAVCRPDFSVEISVRDNGPGVPPDKVERVFEAYYSTKTKGTGLGLSIVKHNVELYAGTVRVESELGKGARFVLIFPAKTVISSPT